MNVGSVIAPIQIAVAGSSFAFGSWWVTLALLALKAPRREDGPPGLRFVAVVPAHNEEKDIATTIRSIRGADFDPVPEVLVVADNCLDATAARARAAGATVLERVDDSRRGKGYALDFAVDFLRTRSAGPPDVVVVIDADTTIGEDFFKASSAGLQHTQVTQARYDVASPKSDLARLRRLAFGLVHHARPLGAKRLGLPTTLKGNGMSFRWEVIAKGMPGRGITEDASATLELAARGVVAEYVPGARVSGMMAERYPQARTQDARWESGRLALAPRAAALALKEFASGRLRTAAAAAELASPPLSLVVVAAAASLAMGIAGYGSALLGGAAVIAVSTYVGVGSLAARAAPRDILALASVPRFLAHKCRVLASTLRARPTGWQRTERG